MIEKIIHDTSDMTAYCSYVVQLYRLPSGLPMLATVRLVVYAIYSLLLIYLNLYGTMYCNCKLYPTLCRNIAITTTLHPCYTIV